MDAAEFFREVVKPNYEEWLAKPDNFRLLWNAVVSMNTVAEFIALHRKDYAQLPRNELSQSANAIRENNALGDLKKCVETLKHVRKIIDTPKLDQKFSTTGTSTGISPNNPVTWKINSLDLPNVCRRSFAILSAWPELQ